MADGKLTVLKTASVGVTGGRTKIYRDGVEVSISELSAGRQVTILPNTKYVGHTDDLKPDQPAGAPPADAK